MDDYKGNEDKYYYNWNYFFWPYYRDVFDWTLKDTAMNRAARNTIKFQNMTISRKGYIKCVVRAIEEEPIVNHNNEIIRLTEPDRKK